MELDDRIAGSSARGARLSLSPSARVRLITLLRIALGLMLINASLFTILHYIALLIPNPASGAFVGELVNSKIMYLSKMTELGAGILLLCNRYVPVTLVAVLPVTIIVSWVDYVLDPQFSSVVACNILVFLNVALLYLHLPFYRSMLVRLTGSPSARYPYAGDVGVVVLGAAAIIFFIVVAVNEPGWVKPSPARGAPILIGKTANLDGAGALQTAIQNAYFEQLNVNGGIAGRPVVLIALNDHGDRDQAERNFRHLADVVKVRALFDSTTPSTADRIVALTNKTGIPLLLHAARFSRLSNSTEASWSTGFLPSYRTESGLLLLLAKRLRPNVPITVLATDTAQGRDYAQGVADFASGPDVKIVRIPQKSNQAEVAAAARLGDDRSRVLVIATEPRLAAGLIARAGASRWTGPIILSSEAATATSLLSEKQLDAVGALYSLRYFKDGNDPAWSKLKPLQFVMWPKWDDDRGVQGYTVFLRKHAPAANSKDAAVVSAYSRAELMAQVLRRASSDPSRVNIMQQAKRLRGAPLTLMTPGLEIYTGVERPEPVSQAQPMRFDGGAWTEDSGLIDIETGYPPTSGEARRPEPAPQRG